MKIELKEFPKVEVPFIIEVTPEPEVVITMSLKQAIILKQLVNQDIDDLAYRDGAEINLPENANEILAYPLWNQLREIIPG